jgi:O-antigen/teichoic acid export membrane protein
VATVDPAVTESGEVRDSATQRAPKHASRRRLPPVVRRLSWGLLDQAVSSLTNFAVSIYVVHQLGAVQYGAFSLAYVTYSFALNASRGLATEPLMIRVSGAPTQRWRRAVAQCTGTSFVLGLAMGILVLIAAMIIHGPVGMALLALGLTLPALLLQDSWRYCFFAHGHGSQAFLNDTVWLISLVAALLAVRATGHSSVFWYVFAWGAAAGVGAAVGPLQAKVMPRVSQTVIWLHLHRDLGIRYLLEGTASSISAQIRSYGITALLGLAAVGYLQAASTLMGPITILFLGMSLATIPEAAKVLRRAPHRLGLFCIAISGVLSAAALGWGILLQIFVPHGLGAWLLGHAWYPTYPLLLPTSLVVVGTGISAGAFAGLHALGAARRSLNVALIGSVATIVFSLAGARWWGVLGSIYGTVAPAWIGSALLWWQLREALHERRIEGKQA